MRKAKRQQRLAARRQNCWWQPCYPELYRYNFRHLIRRIFHRKRPVVLGVGAALSTLSLVVVSLEREGPNLAPPAHSTLWIKNTIF
jgi:hypothetical protein